MPGAILLIAFMLTHSIPTGNLQGGCSAEPQLTAEETRTGRISNLPKAAGGGRAGTGARGWLRVCAPVMPA